MSSHVKSFFALIAAAFVFASLTGTVITWDGGAIFFEIVRTGQPFYAHARHSLMLVQWPTVLLMSATSDLGVLRGVLGLSYAAVPVVCLAACWLIVRGSRPGLFAWPALGLLATLPGRIDLIMESTLLVDMAWVGLMLVVVRPRGWALWLVPLSALMFFMHYAAAGVFALLSVMLFFLTAHSRDRVEFGWAIACAALAVVRVIWRDGYEQTMTADSWMQHFRVAVLWLPALLLLLTWTAGLLSLRWERAAVVALAVAGCVALAWAFSPALWKHSEDYRSSTIFWWLPLAALAVAAGRAAPAPRVISMAGMVFAAVTIVQASMWAGVMWRLQGDLLAADHICVTRAEVSWVNDTALRQWPLPAQSILVQGYAPHAIVAENEDDCTLLGQGKMHIYPWQVYRADELGPFTIPGYNDLSR